MAVNFDFSQKIADSSFSFEWLLQSLKDNDETFQRLHDGRDVKEITATDISEGEGYFSAVMRCVVSFTDSKDPSGVYSTILKIPGTASFRAANAKSGGDCEALEAAANLTAVHQHECDFYNEIAPILDIPVPKVFKTVEWITGVQDGCVHMEDLSRRGRTMTYFESVNLTQIKSVIRTLAHLHKECLASADVWKEKFLKHRRGFADIVGFFDNLVEPFLVKSKRREVFEPYLEKYRKFAFNPEYMVYVHEQAYQDLGLAPVIVHGDIKCGNIMFAIDSNRDIQNEVAAIIDWQVLRQGSPMYDLAYFLAHNADGVVRRQAETFAVEFYYQCLVEEFGGNEIKVPYKLEQLKKSYNEVFITQAFFIPFLAVFIYDGIEGKVKSQRVKDAFFDSIVLRSLHAYQDAESLLLGDMKDVFEKYGQ